MKIRTVTITAAALGLASAPWVGAESGAELFRKLECQSCHSIAAEKIDTKPSEKSGGLDSLAGGEEETKPPDLSDVGAKRDADWLGKWLRKEMRNDDGKKHKEKFKGTDVELQQIVQYLSGLKTKAPGSK